MLNYSLSKNHSGITLLGDYLTLRSFHEVIHEVNENSPIIKDKDGTFLGLAYDVRHAYMGDRKIIKPPKYEKGIGVRYGVDIIWPVILLQSRMLRVALGYFDGTKNQQAFAYAIEHLVEMAIKEDFGSINAPILIQFWQHIDPSSTFPDQHIDSRCAMFTRWDKKERYDKLPGLLASLHPMYELLYKNWSNQNEKIVDLFNRQFSRKNLVSPEEYDTLTAEDWVDFEW